MRATTNLQTARVSLALVGILFVCTGYVDELLPDPRHLSSAQSVISSSRSFELPLPHLNVLLYNKYSKTFVGFNPVLSAGPNRFSGH